MYLPLLSLKELKEDGMKIKDLIKIIKKNPFVESVEHVTGDVDIILKMSVMDINELNDYVVNTLSHYKDVGKTTTALILAKG